VVGAVGLGSPRNVPSSPERLALRGPLGSAVKSSPRTYVIKSRSGTGWGALGLPAPGHPPIMVDVTARRGTGSRDVVLSLRPESLVRWSWPHPTPWMGMEATGDGRFSASQLGRAKEEVVDVIQDGKTWGWNYLGERGKVGGQDFPAAYLRRTRPREKRGLVTREKEKIGDEQEADDLIPALSAAAGRRRQAAGERLEYGRSETEVAIQRHGRLPAAGRSGRLSGAAVELPGPIYCML
jgi:hypothetical protein